VYDTDRIDKNDMHAVLYSRKHHDGEMGGSISTSVMHIAGKAP
jgi:hypothetical protein